VQPFALQCQLGFDQRDIVGNIMANVDVRKCDKLASRSLIARVTRLISNAAARRHVVEGQPDTAMRGRIPWQGAAVERDARPVDDLVARPDRAPPDAPDGAFLADSLPQILRRDLRLPASANRLKIGLVGNLRVRRPFSPHENETSIPSRMHADGCVRRG